MNGKGLVREDWSVPQRWQLVEMGTAISTVEERHAGFVVGNVNYRNGALALTAIFSTGESVAGDCPSVTNMCIVDQGLVDIRNPLGYGREDIRGDGGSLRFVARVVFWSRIGTRFR